MTQYVLMWRTTTSALSWEYRFSQPSNGMAIEFAKRQACLITDHGFMGLDLFNATDSKHVAFISVKTSKVAEASEGRR